ncbi:MAG: DNA-processing protein DprA [Ilumatobacteraceae bacterium]
MNPDDSVHVRTIGDEHVTAAALASLPLVGPQRLRLLIHSMGATDAWHMVRGEIPAPEHIAALCAKDDLGRLWRAAATQELWQRTADVLETHDIQVLLLSDPRYPAVLRADHAAPAVLFARGNLSAFMHRRVGVIGTRAASAAGRHFARQLSRELSQAGVAVVSGLARGIDAAAHHGVCDARGDGDRNRATELRSTTELRSSITHAAPPIAVVATGVDVVYPREHASLWQHVIEHGVLISESAPGCGPDAFRFPLRNRILAAISEVLVVVESRASGGSMITVDEALKRSITVMAVPGSPHSEVSAGTNHLLSQGAATVCHVDDVMVALGLDHRHHHERDDPRVPPTAQERLVISALQHRPLTFNQLVEVLGQPITDVALQLGRLEAHGWVVANAGWWEALVSP